MLVNKKTLVRLIAIITLGSVMIAAALGLLLLFSILKYSDNIGKILLSCLTLVVAGVLGFNSVKAITSGNKIGVLAGFMLAVSAVLFLILIWLSDALGDFYDAFGRIVVIVSSISILLNVIIANYVSLGKHLLAVQIIYYLLLTYIIATIDSVILGSSALIQLWQLFVAAIIIGLTLFVVLVVKGKTLAQKETEIKAADGFITIPKAEYEEMKAEIERLKAIVGEKSE